MQELNGSGAGAAVTEVKSCAIDTMGAGRATTTPIRKKEKVTTTRSLGTMMKTSGTDGVQPSQAIFGNVATIAVKASGTATRPPGLMDIGENTKNPEIAFPTTTFSHMVRIISWV